MAFKKGYKMTEEHKKNLIKSCLGRTPWNKGKKDIYSEEALKAMSIAKEGKTYEERFGKEKSELIKIKMQKHHKQFTEETKIKMRKPKSEEHKMNISLALLGKPFSEEHKRKIREKKIGQTNPLTSGANHYNWKGGITDENSKRLKLKNWKELADKIRIRDNNTCQYCGKPGNDKKLPVHHIISFIISKDDNERNLITLCQSCHIHFEINVKNLGYTILSNIINRKLNEVYV